MSPTWTTFIFEMVNFLVLAAALGWLLFRPVRQVIAGRRAALAQEVAEAAAQHQAAEQLQEEIRRRYAAMDSELTSLRQDALTAAQQEVERLRADAHAAMERERAAAHSRSMHLEEAQMESLVVAVATAAGATVERLLQQASGTELQRAFVQVICRTLRELQQEGLAEVTIESARPLDRETTLALNQALGEAASTAEFRVTPALGTGLRIRTSRGLVDASAAGLAAFARRALLEQLSTPQNHHVPHLAIAEGTLPHA